MISYSGSPFLHTDFIQSTGYVFFQQFQVSCLGVFIQLELVSCKVIDMGQISLFFMWAFSFPAPFVEGSFFPPVYIFVVVKHTHIWVLDFVPMVPAPYYFYYYGSVLYLEKWNDKLTSIVLLAQDCFDCLEFFLCVCGSI